MKNKQLVLILTILILILGGYLVFIINQTKPESKMNKQGNEIQQRQKEYEERFGSNSTTMPPGSAPNSNDHAIVSKLPPIPFKGAGFFYTKAETVIVSSADGLMKSSSGFGTHYSSYAIVIDDVAFKTGTVIAKKLLSNFPSPGNFVAFIFEKNGKGKEILSGPIGEMKLSADGKKIAYFVGSKKRGFILPELWTVNNDGTENKLVVSQNDYPPHSAFWHLKAFSKDKPKVYATFSQNSGAFIGGFYIIDLLTRKFTKFLPDIESSSLYFSPDGTKIAYTIPSSYNCGSEDALYCDEIPPYSLNVFDIDTNATMTIIKSQEKIGSLIFSPDNSHIFYIDSGYDNGGTLTAVDISRKEIREIVKSPNDIISIASVGDRIVYVEAISDGSWWREYKLFSIKFDGSDKREIDQSEKKIEILGIFE
jgi:Tol biopolymer transport system component